MGAKKFNLNLIALTTFFIILLSVRIIYLVALFGCVIFIFLNPVKQPNGEYKADLTYFAYKINYKIIYFFMCLFILTDLMELNGTLLALERVIETTAHHNLFFLCVEILLLTSILSGFLDNEPVTIIFLPIMDRIMENFGDPLVKTPLIVAMVLGINLGGNFLPQGSSADLMNLELAKQNNIVEMNYRMLMKVGASFAILHIIIGVIYLYFLVYFVV